MSARVLVATSCAMLVACQAASSPTPAPSASASRVASPTRQATAAPTPSPAPTATPVPTPGDPPPLALELVVDGLTTPIGIVAGDGGRLYVHEQGGRIVSVATDGSVSEVLDIGDRISSGGERGVLGLAFHPGWPETGRAFVHYTDPNRNTVLSEFASTASEPPALDPGSERIVLQATQPAGNHNGGQLDFGPDGYLYMALGDGGGGGDPFGNAQNPGTVLGAILRLDVDGAEPYAIPADNPFASGGGAPEVFAYGLRNPWRFSFDTVGRSLWIGDVGRRSWEEIDRLPLASAAGANLGWNAMEGAHCFADPACDPAAFIGPVAEYPTSEGCAVTGGYVYRGSALSGLFGWYLFSDYCSGLLYGIRSDATPQPGSALAPEVLLQTGMRVASLGEDADGELYVADAAGGAIYRIVAAP